MFWFCDLEFCFCEMLSDFCLLFPRAYAFFCARIPIIANPMILGFEDIYFLRIWMILVFFVLSFPCFGSRASLELQRQFSIILELLCLVAEKMKKKGGKCRKSRFEY